MTPPRTKRSDLAARAAAIAGEKPTPPPAEVEPQEPPARRKDRTPAAADSPRVKPVRVVVELQPVEHRNLRRLADRYADDLGVPQVAMAEVLRVLLQLAQDDDQVAAKVGKELTRTGGTRRG